MTASEARRLTKGLGDTIKEIDSRIRLNALDGIRKVTFCIDVKDNPDSICEHYQAEGFKVSKKYSRYLEFEITIKW